MKATTTTTTTKTPYFIYNGDLFVRQTEVIDTTHGPVTVTDNRCLARKVVLQSLGLNLPHDGDIHLTSHE